MLGSFADIAIIRGGNLGSMRPRKWHNPTWPHTGELRGCDDWGCGFYGASRGEDGPHLAVDYVSVPGSEVRAVTGGFVAKLGYPYGSGIGSLSDSEPYRYVRIVDPPYQVDHFYVQPAGGITPGSRVNAGAVIGTAQRISRRYPGITEHVHLRIWYPDDYINAVILIGYIYRERGL